MAMVVTESCNGCKDKSCLAVCPVECFHEDDVPRKWHSYIKLNAQKAKECPPAEEP